MAVMSAVALRRVTWTLIYSGLLFVMVGLYVHRTDEMFGITMIAIGAVEVFVGLALIVVRSRMKDEGP
jgi:NADH:ubiquinone oxidoreductase subunit K